MNLNIHTGLGARFKLQVRKLGTNKITKESAWSDNIVLDSGLARMSVGTWIDRCCVGTGNSMPVASQVALDNFLASTTTNSSKVISLQTVTAPYYSQITQKWSFGIGVAAGNISEIGLGWGNANLWDRALVKDASGNPTTITVLADEYLDVTSEIRIYPKASVKGAFNLLDKTGAVKSTHNYAGIPYLSRTVDYANGKLTFDYVRLYAGDMGGSATSQPTGIMSIGGLNITYPTPTSAQCIATFSLNNANNSHRSITLTIGGLGIHEHTLYKMQIDPPITKTNLQVMTYTVTMSWGRYNAA